MSEENTETSDSIGSVADSSKYCLRGQESATKSRNRVGSDKRMR